VLGLAFTVSDVLAVAVQPLAVTVTVYGPAVLTVLAAVVGPLLHAYVPPPLAVKVVLPPEHIVVVPVIPAVGNGFTVSVVLAVAVQPLVVTVTVYGPAVLTVLPAVVGPLLHA
jgi:hypothetical protein